LIDDLLAAGRRLRDSQLSGAGGKLRDAIEAERVALDRAMRNAEEIATHARLATTSTLQRVRETLHLAALDADVAAEVKRGVLVREGRAAGFTGLAGFTAPAAPAEPATTKSDPAKRDTAKREAAKRTTAKIDAAKIDKRRETKRRQQLAQARDKAAAAQRDLKAAERELADAGRALAAATRAHDRSQTRVDRARARCETEQKRVDELGNSS
jgi:hypothetical protein